MGDFKAKDIQFFTDFKKVKFKSYNEKNCSLSQNEMIKIIEGYKFRPFNDRVAYLEVYTSNKIEGNKLTRNMTEEIFETKSIIPKSDDLILLDDITENKYR